MCNEIFDTCEHCGSTYNPDSQGHEHNDDCECIYCDPEHSDFDKINGAPIRKYVMQFGRLCFCCQECEINFIRGTRDEKNNKTGNK